MSIASKVFDRLADFFRGPHELNRSELLELNGALGIMHTNLLAARELLAEYREYETVKDGLESTVFWGRHLNVPSAYERRQLQNLRPEILETRAQIAAVLLGTNFVPGWRAMLAKSGENEGWIPGKFGENKPE